MTNATREGTEQGLFRRLPEEKRRRVTEAAVAEFAEQGYRAASMNEVIARAGISKGSLFKYFSTKGALFGYVYRGALATVKEYLRRAREETRDEPFFRRLELLVHAGVAFIREHPHLARLHYRIFSTGEIPERESILREIHAESLHFLGGLVEEGMARGELRADLDPARAAFVLESVLGRYLQAHDLPFLAPGLRDAEGRVDEEAWVRELMEIFRRGLGHA